MSKSPYTQITIAVAEMVGGEPGIPGIVKGLGEMKAWCEVHAPGSKYQRRSCRFQFTCLEHKVAFEQAFAKALSIASLSTTAQ